MANEKIGGTLAAMARQGAKDFHDKALVAFPSHGSGVDEPGTPLSPTQQMVTKSVSSEYDQMLAQYSARGQGKQPEQQMEH